MIVLNRTPLVGQQKCFKINLRDYSFFLNQGLAGLFYKHICD